MRKHRKGLLARNALCTGIAVVALALLPLAAGAVDSGPSLSHDWEAMTENEKFCVVPSHQDQTACRWTGPSVDEVMKAYRSRHYDKALAGFAAAARAGHTWGMWAEGSMYWFAYGVERDRPRAFGLVQAAAILGDTSADDLARQMSRAMSGAELLRSERTTEEYLALGSASYRTRLKWAAEQLGVVIDATATAREAGAENCAARIPSIDLSPRVAKNPRPRLPDYSISARREGRSADVYVAGLLDSQGRVCRVIVLDSVNGTERMGRDALEAIRTWTFNAATLDGQPVQSLVMIKVQYRIRP